MPIPRRHAWASRGGQRANGPHTTPRIGVTGRSVGGAVAGTLLALLLTAGSVSAATRPGQTGPSPATGPVVVQVGSPAGSRGMSLLSGLVGGLVGAAGAVGAQLLIRRFELQRRRANRALTRLDLLVDAVDGLELALLRDGLEGTPPPEVVVALQSAQGRFDRAVELVDDPPVRDSARSWERLARQYALVQADPGAPGGPVARDVRAAQLALLELVRARQAEAD